MLVESVVRFSLSTFVVVRCSTRVDDDFCTSPFATAYLGCGVASRSEVAVTVEVTFVAVLLSLLLSLAAADVAVVDELDSNTNSFLACTAGTTPGASEHTLRGLTGVLVDPVAFCVDRYESSFPISVMMRWSTPACCSTRLLLDVDVVDTLCTESPLVFWSAAVTELISLMTTPGWSLEDVVDDLVAVLELDVADELTARCCWVLLLLDVLLDVL